MRTPPLTVLLCSVLLMSTHSFGQPVDATPILREGQTLPEGTVDGVGAPFVAGDVVGFTGAVIDAAGELRRFVWQDAGILFLDTDALPAVLTGAESTMGIAPGGDFIYSPATNGEDSVWTANGALLVEPDPIPGTPFFSAFNSRPQMTAAGTARWIGGYSDVPAGSTAGRMLLESSSGGLGPIGVVYAGGDPIGADVITASGIDFDYHFSADDSHQIVVLDVVAGVRVVAVDGTIVLREGDPTGGGDLWDNFDAVAINNSGDYLVTGDTDGAATVDEFIAVNGSIAVRQGDTIDGVLLDGGSLRGVMINDNGQVAHLWGITGGTEVLFLGSATDLAGTSVELLRTDDEVDLTGDGVADGSIVDFNASVGVGPGVSLTSTGTVFVEVDLLDIGTMIEGEAIIALGGAAPPTTLFRRGDSNDDGAVNIADAVYSANALFVPLSPAPACPDAADANDDGAFNIADVIWVANFLFVTGSPPPPAPFPDCGSDPTADGFDCSSFVGTGC